MKRPKPTDLAWFAGLMEGEGTFHYPKTSTKRSLKMAVAMTDKDVVERAMALFPGVGALRTRQPSGISRQVLWQWQVCKRTDVVAIISMIRPFMGQRRGEKIDECLDYNERYPAVVDSKGRSGLTMKNAAKTTCLRGHNFTVRNGKRVCIPCTKVRSKRPRKPTALVTEQEWNEASAC